MSELTLTTVRDVVVVNHENMALDLSMRFAKLPKNKQREHFAGSRLGGYFYLFLDPEVSADTFLECVVSTKGDAITSLYKANRIFNSTGQLLAKREELIRAIAAKVGLSPEGVGVDDPGRGRTLGLEELSTGQLIDLLAEKMGATIITSDTHNVAGAGLEDVPTLTVDADGRMSVSGG